MRLRLAIALQPRRASLPPRPLTLGPGASLAWLSLASLGWAFSFGLGAPLASLWLRDHGFCAGAIGLDTSLYYLGVALTSPFVPGLMSARRGAPQGPRIRSCIVLGMALDAVATMAFPWVWPGWQLGLLRFTAGAGTALSLIPMETLVNRCAPPHRRARHFAVYAVSVALGIALGGLVGLPIYPSSPHLAFALGGAVTLLAVIPAWVGSHVPEPHCEPRAVGPSGAGGEVCLVSLQLSSHDAVLGLGTGWAQGFLEGGMMAFLAIYLGTIGYAEAQASGLMGALFLGVVLAQLPVACLADRLGRTRVLLICHLIVLLGLAVLPQLAGPVGVAGWLFVLGACCGALYPLGLAVLGERVPQQSLATANAWYLTSNCAGSLGGPLLLGLAIQLWGPRAQFGGGALALLLVLGAWAVLAARRSVVDNPACRAPVGEPASRRAA